MTHTKCQQLVVDFDFSETSKIPRKAKLNFVIVDSHKSNKDIRVTATFHEPNHNGSIESYELSAYANWSKRMR